MSAPSPCRHLYLHIPFCPKVCPYCNFYKEAGNRNKIPAFLDAILLEAEKHRPILQPHTIFFGGGTPSALTTQQLDRLLSGLHSRLDLSQVQEWTLEINPATFSLEKAKLLLEHGVNRASIGIQAWQPELLATLGRVHTTAQAERSYAILRESGFKNINIDLIFGIPGQTVQQWEASLQKTIALSPEHISAYALTYEEDTEFFLSLQSGKFEPNEDLEVQLFDLTQQILESAGYLGYEISNFARPGFECQHNWAYWIGADSIGLGPSAFSTYSNRRWRNVENTTLYTELILSGKSAANFEESLDPITRRKEQIAFGLRTHLGIHRNLVDIRQINLFLEQNFLELQGENIRLTRKGRALADAIALELIPS